MAKKAVKKKAKKRVRQNWCQMVIRVRVPIKEAKAMRVWQVLGVRDDRGPPWSLEVLSAYYDLPGQPNASRS